MSRFSNGQKARFYPTGYIGLEQATLRLARRVDPKEWEGDSMLHGEGNFWSGLAIETSAASISGQLWARYRDSNSKEKLRVYLRVQSFLHAQQQLQKWLFSGEVRGEYVDENGRWGWILKEGWSTAGGLEVLEEGVALLEDNWVRLVLVREADLDELIERLDASASDKIEGGHGRVAGEEEALIIQLASLLKENPDISKTNAAEAIGLSPRSSAYERRIWPRGRLEAGLSERGNAGRKKTTQRNQRKSTQEN